MLLRAGNRDKGVDLHVARNRQKHVEESEHKRILIPDQSATLPKWAVDLGHPVPDEGRAQACRVVADSHPIARAVVVAACREDAAVDRHAACPGPEDRASREDRLG